MAIILNDPSWWPFINFNSYRTVRYFIVAASAGVVYDWVLTFGQEVELVWRQRWSLMTALYLTVRYAGILIVVGNIVASVPTISMTDAGCRILYFTENWITSIVNAILGVIMIARLHAMYQRSRKVLIFLVVVFLAVNVFVGLASAISTRNISVEELILSDTYQCNVAFKGDVMLLFTMTWILATAWEVLALCLAACIAVKHFRELRQHSAGGIIGDCFTVLMTTHVVYFASFVAVSCFELSSIFSTTFVNPTSLGTDFFFGFLGIFRSMQMVVLGPRLILGVREYHARLVAGSDVATDMTSIVFQERVHAPTGSSV